jgi:2',3'-cyclic-nucleotide 2'-phosphodiesterase (5'-nucleotidase family)
MNMLDYDFVAFNQGDFHGGSDTLAQFIDGLNNDTTAIITNADVSTDNYLNSSRPNGKPRVAQWAVKTFSSQSIGVINVLSPDIKQYTVGAQDILLNKNPNTCGSSEAMVRTALFEMKSEHPDCKIIVAVSDHEDDTAMLASQIEDIDVVLSPVVDKDKVSTNIFGQSVAQVQFGPKYGQAIGCVSLAFDRQGNLKRSHAVFEQLDNRTSLDPAVWAFTDEKTRVIETSLATTVGHTRTNVYGERGCHIGCAAVVDLGGCRFGDCGMARLATSAFDYACERYGRICDLALVNGGAIRGSFDAGNITAADLMRVFPFEPSPFSIVAIRGSTLMETLARMTKRGNVGGSSRDNTGAFLHFKGLRYAWNPDLTDVASRIVRAEVYNKQQEKWQPLNPFASYEMIAQDFYVISGGDAYRMLPEQVEILERLVESPRMAVTEYVRNKGTLSIPSYHDLRHCNDGKGIDVSKIETCLVMRTPEVETWYGPCLLGHFRDRHAGEWAPSAPIMPNHTITNLLTHACRFRNLEPPICTACPAGSYMDSELAGSGEVFKCRPCGVGMYAAAIGSIHCSVCPATHYASGNGSEECDQCPLGSMRRRDEIESSGNFGVSKNECECQDGFFVLDGARGSVCAECPVGAICRGSVSLPSPKPGYWVDLSNEKLLFEHIKCKHAWVCTGGGVAPHGVAFGSNRINSSSACFESPESFARCVMDSEYNTGRICAAGHTGRLCSVCNEGWYRTQDVECRECAHVDADAKYIFLFIFIGSMPIALFILYCHYGPRIKLMLPRLWALVFEVSRFKVLLSTVQIIGSISSSTDVMWPEPFASLARVYEISMLSPFDVLPLGCAMNFSFYHKLLIAAFLPLGLVLVLYSCCCLYGPNVSHPVVIRCKEYALLVMVSSTNRLYYSLRLTV